MRLVATVATLSPYEGSLNTWDVAIVAAVASRN